MDFEYHQVAIPEDGLFKISPSQISKFFEYPSIWYKEQVLGEKDFKGSTATVLGTVIHAIAEAVAKNEPTEKEEIEKFLQTHAKNQDVDIDEIKQLYPAMAGALINEYVLKNRPTDTEKELCALVKDGIYVSGSCDNRTNDIVVDYKNVSKKPNTDSIPFGYKIQMLAYAFMYRAMGTNIERIRLVYTVRPTKTLPVRTFVVTEMITADDWKLIEDTLGLIADTMLLADEHPEYIYMLFKSMKLKEQ